MSAQVMPGHPDPRVPLDRAGQTDETIRMYETALEVHGGYLPAMQGSRA